MSMVFLGGCTYFTGLGLSAESKNNAKYGAILGAIILVLSIAIINTALLLNAKDIVFLEIPMLFLGRKISYIFGATFSIVVLLGTFSSCSSMMWSICNRFTRGGKRGNQFFAVLVSIFVFVFGLLPFSELVGALLPFLGYVGLLYIGCVIYKGIKGYKTLKSNIKEGDHGKDMD